MSQADPPRSGAPFKVLVTDPIDAEGLEPLRGRPGIELVIELRPDPERLRHALEKTCAWLVRSETRVSAEWIERAPALRLIGRAGVGVDNIDLEAASRRGIAVVNAPQASTLAACEHTWAMLLALARNIPQADAQMRQGLWERSHWIGTELSGKTLGIVGLGRIGREVAKRALAHGMRLVAHDPFVSQEQARGAGAELLGLEELLERSDFITLHAPGTPSTRALIHEGNASRIKPGARLVNCARGELVPDRVLLSLLESGRLKGAALDVFEAEPLPKDSPLRRDPRVVLTPHLGASTEEAQRRVAEELAREVLEFHETGWSRHAINLPGFDSQDLETLGPYLALGETLGRFLAQTLDSGVRELRCEFQGDFEPRSRHPVAVAALKGLLEAMLGRSANFVNAPLLAAERGLKVSESADPAALEGFARLLTVSAVTDAGERGVSGAILAAGQPRIVRLGGLFVDVPPRGRMLVIANRDRPGMIGQVGRLLGERGINIADMRVGRHSPKGEAVMVILVDDDAPPELLRELAAIDGITGVRWVRL